MIDLRRFDDRTALTVFQHLDPNDFLEAELVRGQAASAIGLWADWRAAQAVQFASFVAHAPRRGNLPFAVLCLAHSGQAGIAEGALLARHHRMFRRELAALCVHIRRDLPAYAADRGIYRIECRSWAGHPTAGRLLAALGFRAEVDMAGFGPGGQAVFTQFAWTSPVCCRPQP